MSPATIGEATHLAGLIGPGAPCDLDRARGVLLGLAVGNVLGLPVHFRPRAELLARYPDGVNAVDPDEAWRPLDDDLAHALELGEALLDGDPVASLRARLIRWKHENGRNSGRTTTLAIANLERGLPVPEAAIHASELLSVAPGSGATMRSAPLAILHCADPAAMFRAGIATCLVTHAATECQWSVLLVTALIASHLRGEAPTLESIASALERDGAPDGFTAAVRAVDPHCDPSVIGFEYATESSAVLAAQSAAWASSVPSSEFSAPLVRIVSAGGDTDTHGAIAGAVLGARFGLSTLPREWLVAVPQRPRIERLAFLLSTASQERARSQQ